MRYQVGTTIPFGSADASLVVRDEDSGMGEVRLITVDPEARLTEESREQLAQIVADAVNRASFHPRYEE